MENQKKKGGCLKWGLIVVSAILVVSAIASVSGGKSDTNSGNSVQTSVAISADDNSQASDSVSEAVEQNITTGEKNALKKAKQYLAVSAFSHDGLIKQLEFEGYTTEEATYAADNVGADWNEQAAKKGKDYLAVSAFSRDGLIQQLEFEGFTTEQAEYGAQANGY